MTDRWRGTVNPSQLLQMLCHRRLLLESGHDLFCGGQIGKARTEIRHSRLMELRACRPDGIGCDHDAVVAGKGVPDGALDAEIAGHATDDQCADAMA